MNSSNALKAKIVIASLFMLLLVGPGCSDGKERALVSTWVCARSVDGIEQLRAYLKSTAESEHGLFADNSEITARDLRTIGYKKDTDHQSVPVLQVSITLKDGTAVYATNVGLPGYQVAIQFFEGLNKNNSLRFAEQVVRNISNKWELDRLPTGSAVAPRVTCL